MFRIKTLKNHIASKEFNHVTEKNIKNIYRNTKLFSIPKRQNSVSNKNYTMLTVSDKVGFRAKDIT